jgi:hypothetical protein
VSHRIVWPITVLVGLVILVVGISSMSAQRPQPGGSFINLPPQTGRFVVAHASADKVLVLDSVTGKIYRVTESDFKKASEMPKVGMPMMPFNPFTDKDRGRRPKDLGPPLQRDKAAPPPDRDKVKKDKAPLRDKEKESKEADVKDKDRKKE